MKLPISTVLLLLATTLGFGLAGCGQQEPTAESLREKPQAVAPEPAYEDQPTLAELEAAVPENPLKEAYFGETHVHTSYSLDAYIGGARLTPSDAYRFAKGRTVTIAGREHNISRPLDFAAVSDHAEFLGEMYSTQVEGAPGHDQIALDELRSLEGIEQQNTWFQKWVISNMRSAEPGHPPFYAGPETTKSAWQVEIDAAVEHYVPGEFTTIVGFEWTASQDAGNMHRNVLFRDLTLPDMPLSALDTNDEEKLWEWMAEQEQSGSRLLAIPHNSNGSKGLMFESTDNAGNPLDAAYARTRSHFERLIEMMQIKGNSEVTQSLWQADEFAGFEDAASINTFSGRKKVKENYVRWAVIKGVAYHNSLGVNPWKFGFTGGTDNHNGLPSDVDEDNYIGSHGPFDGTVEARRNLEVDGWIKSRESNPGSIAAVWAPKNTRAAIWDAMWNRETFVTSGPRIKVRFFGGPDLSEPESAISLVKEGYAVGVPMGGTLESLEKSPSFTVYAMRDPEGANLDRIQIIKGWSDESDEPQEKIIDVVWSGQRLLDDHGRLPVVGDTVNPDNATYTNDIGAAELMGYWTDDDFDPQCPAVYYVRVIEIPTPRYTTYDAVRNDLPLLEDVPPVIQERAWTSPIWYTP
jgi:hypothetical protein